MSDADIITVGVVVGIIVLAIIIILLASRNANHNVIVQESREEVMKPDKPDEFPREKNNPIGDTMRPATLSFCPSCGRRLHGTAFVCPYCKKRL